MRQYCLNGSLFNQWRLQAHTKTQGRLMWDLLFTDDASLVTHTERALQYITTFFADTALQHQGQPQEDRGSSPAHSTGSLPSCPVTIVETERESVQQFTYPCGIISSDARINKKVDNRLAKANGALGRLYKRVWNNKNLKNKTKILVYLAVVLTILLYSSKVWVTCWSHF